MKIMKGANAQVTLTKRQAERNATIKKLAVAVLVAILIFLALLMLESSIISDEVYTYVISAKSDILPGTSITKDNYSNYFETTAISSRSSDEYRKIVLEDSLDEIQNYSSEEDALSALQKVVSSKTYTAYPISKLDYLNLDSDLSSSAKYIDTETTQQFYATNKDDASTYHRVKIIDPMDISFAAANSTTAVAGELRAGDIVELGFTSTDAIGGIHYYNGWDKEVNEPVVITHKHVKSLGKKLDGYYTIYKYGVQLLQSGTVNDAAGNKVTEVEGVNYQRGTLYISDADTGKVILSVREPVKNAAGGNTINAYETYFNKTEAGDYILTTDGWKPYVDGSIYGNEVDAIDFNKNDKYMDLSAIYLSSAFVAAGNEINAELEAATTEGTPISTLYKAIISKADIEYFYKFTFAGSLTITKVLDANSDPALVMPEAEIITKAPSKYVTIGTHEIELGNYKAPTVIENIPEPVNTAETAGAGAVIPGVVDGAAGDAKAENIDDKKVTKPNP